MMSNPIEQAVSQLWKEGASANDVVKELAIALASIAMVSKPKEFSWNDMKAIVLDELEQAKHALQEDQSHG
jgi:uncharacterized protein YerC